MHDERSISYIDHYILDTIRKYGEFHDRDIAEKLHCPRTLLLERLAGLISKGFVTGNSEKYALSEKGASEWIPLDDLDEAQAASFCAESFDWTPLYIPAKGWDHH